MKNKILCTLLISLLVLSTSACHVISLIANIASTNYNPPTSTVDNTLGDQGSVSSPATIGSYPVYNYAGSVGGISTNTGNSYYRVDGISPGGTYTITLTHVNGYLLGIFVYEDSTYSTALCYYQPTASGENETCNTNMFAPYYGPTGTSLYIEVDNGSTAKATYNLSVQ